ncbi:MAG: hypothetical protein JEY94_09790 [Melioribacteraceae bacterium]|nr:hypothetical protein [Melioribacteraceae bacterium]
MGQQQLLLIVLGIIIVGVAITVGISVFKANAIENKRNNVINDLIHLASEAQKYHKIPKAMGGGGNEFTGWDIPTSLKTNADGTFTAAVTAQSVEITGIGNEVVQDNDLIEVKMTVTSESFTTEVIH